MRILYSVFNIMGRGTYWRAFHLARHLVKRGHNVDILVTSPNRRLGIREEVQEGVKLIEVPDLLPGSLRSGWDIWNIANRISKIRSSNYDLVHSFECRPTAILPALFVARRLNIPLLTDWSDWLGRGGSVEERPNPMVRTFLRPVETFFEENLRKYADGTTVICTTLQDKAIKLGLSPDSILLLYNGSNIDQVISIPMLEARRKIGLPEDAFIIGHVGSLFRRDAMLMGESFNLLNDSIPNPYLVITGYSPYDVRKHSNHQSRIIRTRYLDQNTLNIYLASCNLFWVLLSDTNANRGRFPLKLTDYLALGRPIIATDIGDIPLLFNQAEVGYLCKDSPQDIVDKTLRLYENPPLSNEMSQSALRLAEEKYAWGDFSFLLENFYQRIYQKKCGSKEITDN